MRPAHPMVLSIFVAASACGISKPDAKEKTHSESIPFLEVLAGEDFARGVPGFHGIVFEDLDGDQVRDPWEPGIAGVPVSNGFEVQLTGLKGGYSLPLHDEGLVFITKPSGYAVYAKDDGIQGFYALHDGLSIRQQADFALIRRSLPEQFRILSIGDPQVRNLTELGYLKQDIIPELGSHGAAFGIVQGDLVFDKLELFQALRKAMNQGGLPLYYVPGNHDSDFGVTDDGEFVTYKKFFGPSYYSFDHGNAHFIVLDTVILEEGRKYHGGISENQMHWLENDLREVAEDKLVVLNMHIPFASYTDRNNRRQMINNRAEVYELLRKHQVLSLAGHTHTLENFAAGHGEAGWGDTLPFDQLITGAACGAWWGGFPKSDGVPEAYLRDGAPNGYAIIDFAGSEYSARYKAAGVDQRDVMHATVAVRGKPVDSLHANELPEAGIFVNGWFSRADALVSCAFGKGDLMPARQVLDMGDPFLLKVQDASVDRRPSNHLWQCSFPPDLAAGETNARIILDDGFGNPQEMALAITLLP